MIFIRRMLFPGKERFRKNYSIRSISSAFRDRKSSVFKSLSHWFPAQNHAGKTVEKSNLKYYIPFSNSMQSVAENFNYAGKTVEKSVGDTHSVIINSGLGLCDMIFNRIY